MDMWVRRLDGKLTSSSQEPVACPASVDAEVAINRIFDGAMTDSAAALVNVAVVRSQGPEGELQLM